MGGFHSVLIRKKIISLLELIIIKLQIRNKEERIVNLYGIKPSFEKFLDDRKENDRNV